VRALQDAGRIPERVEDGPEQSGWFDCGILGQDRLEKVFVALKGVLLRTKSIRLATEHIAANAQQTQHYRVGRSSPRAMQER
jgi:hypothetical protein